ncbi:hypothetical protein LCGC14_1415850 [marine sediment metagenome]|uniref:Uncharacterized protein n=1 Tax=marine sediment metagenome TaxID=412755 RepID=A0A0F9JT93_9ZZZZ
MRAYHYIRSMTKKDVGQHARKKVKQRIEELRTQADG